MTGEARSQVGCVCPAPDARSRRDAGRSSPWRLPAQASRRGVALVITLIMLSVITFMAVTFLVLSHRERGAVAMSTAQVVARNVADSGYQRAMTEIMANILASTNDQNFGLIVSTNFINYLGLNPAPDAVGYATNINYTYTIAGAPLTQDQMEQNIASLLLNPRAPVYMTNAATTQNEFRYYLDLNRNRMAETNGFWPVISSDPLNPYYDANGNTTPFLSNAVRRFFVGDPEWIGVLEYPDRPHSATNRFVGRYAYIVIPVGKTLDVNYLHNATVSRLTGQLDPDGYMRNQGVGPWENNLAAFWRDLNTNFWFSYDYRAYLSPPPAVPIPNVGIAFEDARAILNFRYAGNYANLDPASVLFPNAGSALTTDGIDGYSDGPLPPGTKNIDESIAGNADVTTIGWAGSDNPNHYFSIQDFFDPNKTGVGGVLGFTNRMTQPGLQTNSYDRYTYYRMLAQLGTDSTPQEDKINVNYVNVDGFGRIVPNAETNFIPWQAAHFFTNAANRVLRMNTTLWSEQSPPAYFGSFGTTEAFGVTNIPVFRTYIDLSNAVSYTRITYGYTPAVHRLLQVVANIYDSTTNRADLGGGEPYLPHVYRPVFRRNSDASEVWIAGYQEVIEYNSMSGLLMGTPAAPMVDLSRLADRQRLAVAGTPFGAPNTELMVAGVPMVVGARKGLPNFNKFALQNAIRVTRKLYFRRPGPSQPINQTNQIYSLALSNAFGFQAWNSYAASYPRPLSIVAEGEVTLSLTNRFGTLIGPYGFQVSNRFVVPIGLAYTNIPANAWPGFSSQYSFSSAPFAAPYGTNYMVLTNSEYRQLNTSPGIPSTAGDRFYPPSIWDSPNYYNVPEWWLTTRSRLRVAIVDTGVVPNRIIDYVNLDSTEAPLNIMDTIQMVNTTSFNTGSPSDPDPGTVWQTNRYGSAGYTGAPVQDDPRIPTYGIYNQIRISLGDPNVSDSYWRKYNANNNTVNDKTDAIRNFTQRLFPGGVQNNVLVFEAPFDPTRTFYQYVRLEANDPLVHYTVPDLKDLMIDTQVGQWDSNDKSPLRRLISENPLSDHYRPWNGNPGNPAETTPPTQRNTAVKDPLRLQSGDWDFPTNRMPNIGWLGRVHSGRPWMSVYLKSVDDTNAWSRLSGNSNLFDAYVSRPIEDRTLFDIFTTAINQNATRGQLSINQDGLAAWSAILSGVIVVTNSMTGPPGETPIEPAGIYFPGGQPPLVRIVDGINNARNKFRNRTFTSLGDILSAPELSEESPFLTGTNSLLSDTAAGINDEILERIPQQIMSLLTLSHSPRFVIYSYGQTLQPADRSVISSGRYGNLCMGYQVTAETATRTVVRIEGSPNPRYTNDVFRPHPDAFGRFYPPRVVIEQFNVLPPD